MSLSAVKVVDDCIEIDEHEMLNKAIYTIVFRGEPFYVTRDIDGKIYIFQTEDSYEDPPCKNDSNKPWL
jgi:hypothetical protein